MRLNEKADCMAYVAWYLLDDGDDDEIVFYQLCVYPS